ncbi:MAG: arginine--tRNA ligase [Proteobacteria bacterium]|nr:arginine--tRNA ligase [Pseudomonadota bacterium]
MRRQIKEIIESNLINLKDKLNFETLPDYEIEIPGKKDYGDFSTNIAMLLGSKLRKNPREIAKIIVENISSPFFEKIEIAGPGFINFFLNFSHILEYLKNLSGSFRNFLEPKTEKPKKILIEYVSANPTGPLHIGHGRGATIGSTLALILKELGNEVIEEFYINDAGSQIRNLGISILRRCRELQGEKVEFEEGLYLGEYVIDLAKEFSKENGFFGETEENIEKASDFGKNIVLGWIKNDLRDFEVVFDNYISERSIYNSGEVDRTIEKLKDKGYLYEKDSAIWFKSTEFGDDKDRVVIKENGEKTYFASDIAYHKNKFERGFDYYVNIWGADHHGYVKRVLSAIKALGYDEKKLSILMVQMVSLFRAGRQVTMSKRAGDFITLREVLDEVGKSGMRFMFLTRKNDSPLDFDIELVKQKTTDNPVFYVQYMYARINSVLRVAKEKGIDVDKIEPYFNRLDLDEEKELIYQILSFPDLLFDIAERSEPHLLSYYLINLAQIFHSYYNAHRFINEDDTELTISRINLLKLLKITVERGLYLLKVDAPEQM